MFYMLRNAFSKHLRPKAWTKLLKIYNHKSLKKKLFGLELLMLDINLKLKTYLGPELSERLSQLGSSVCVFRLGRREFGRLQNIF